MQTSNTGTGFDVKRLSRIADHLTSNYLDTGKIPGCQILVSRHGIPAYFESLGEMDRERQKPMREDTIFRIYSMTKPITSIALMQLYEQGRFQLNDPVYRVIPEWKDQKVWLSGEGENMVCRNPESPMTFRHLLTHTSGITYGATAHPVDKAYRVKGIRRDQGETLATFVKKLAEIPLRFDPGQRWLYSYSTDICGYLVEALSGESLDNYLQKNIFDPLGMKDTAFHVAEDKKDRFAANYRRNTDKTLTLIDDPEKSVYLEKKSFLSGGGGLVSTTRDYYRFCEMLRQNGYLDGERIIGPRTLRLMTRNHLKDGRDLKTMAIGDFSETPYEGIGFGLGFAMTLGQVVSGGYGEGDYYWGGAASTIFWVDPVEDLIVIFMVQLMPSATFNFRGQLKNLIYSSITD